MYNAPAIPPIQNIADQPTKNALLALVDGWQVRNGAGDNGFATRAEMIAAIAAAPSGAAKSTVVSLPGSQPTAPSPTTSESPLLSANNIWTGSNKYMKAIRFDTTLDGTGLATALQDVLILRDTQRIVWGLDTTAAIPTMVSFNDAVGGKWKLYSIAGNFEMLGISSNSAATNALTVKGEPLSQHMTVNAVYTDPGQVPGVSWVKDLSATHALPLKDVIADLASSGVDYSNSIAAIRAVAGTYFGANDKCELAKRLSIIFTDNVNGVFAPNAGATYIPAADIVVRQGGMVVSGFTVPTTIDSLQQLWQGMTSTLTDHGFRINDIANNNGSFIGTALYNKINAAGAITVDAAYGPNTNYNIPGLFTVGAYGTANPQPLSKVIYDMATTSVDHGVSIANLRASVNALSPLTVNAVYGPNTNYNIGGLWAQGSYGAANSQSLNAVIYDIGTTSYDHGNSIATMRSQITTLQGQVGTVNPGSITVPYLGGGSASLLTECGAVNDNITNVWAAIDAIGHPAGDGTIPGNTHASGLSSLLSYLVWRTGDGIGGYPLGYVQIPTPQAYGTRGLGYGQIITTQLALSDVWDGLNDHGARINNLDARLSAHGW